MSSRHDDHEQSDAELVRRARDGDAQAFADLHDRHADGLLRAVAPMVGSLALDVVAETFARAWLQRGRVRDRNNGSAWPWLATIARNLAVDTQRHEAVETRARERLGMRVDWYSEAGYEGVDERLSLSTCALGAVEALPAHERVALQLRVVDELPYDEIGRRLAIRPAAARLRVSRAIQRILKATGGTP